MARGAVPSSPGAVDSLIQDSEWELHLMFGTIQRKGFCSGCVQNILNVRRIDSRSLRILDQLTFRLAAYFNVGPWHCTYCGTKTLYLKSPVAGMRDFENDKIRDQKTADEMPVGNFISREQSIVGSSDNAERFSQKYRDGIVLKLLKGQATMSQVGAEINVSERDLMSWIREYVIGQQQLMAEEIEQLKLFISEANQNTLALNYRSEIEDSLQRFNSSLDSSKYAESRDPVIEGKARPAVE